MNYKLVLIDLDDTLFDYPKTEKTAFRNTFEELGFFVESDLEYAKKEEICKIVVILCLLRLITVFFNFIFLESAFTSSSQSHE